MEGRYINGRVSFPEQTFQLRTDTDFRLKIQPDHHLGTSILEHLPDFDIINDFVVDPMHLIYLGVVKKIINLWVTGKPSSKLSAIQINTISDKLLFLKRQICCEFNRKPRPLSEYKRWKATEFRQFLLYTGPLVLKDVVKKDMYINFISLHVAITILCNPKLQHLFINEADKCLKYFFQTFLIVYRKENASHNIHKLLHLVNDSRKYGVLENFSGFQFENYMSRILNMIRKSSNR